MDDPLLEFIMEDAEGRGFHLIFGGDHDDEHVYVMYGDRPHVFLAERRHIEGLLGLNPFNFIDRFIALVNIMEVERITLQSRLRGNHELIINNFQDDDERDQIDPIVDGIEVQDRAFRGVYQALIGMFYDQEIELQEEPGIADLIISYYLLDPLEDPIVVEFFAYDANFYAVRRQPEPVQFVINRRAVEVAYSLIEDLLAGELDR
jgi:hypothetical protein